MIGVRAAHCVDICFECAVGTVLEKMGGGGGVNEKRKKKCIWKQQISLIAVA